jgi:hypothetical protein
MRRLNSLASAALALVACACVTARPMTIAALAPRDVVTISREQVFDVVLQDGRFAEGRGPCSVRSITGRVERVAGDSIHFEIVLRAVPASWSGPRCPENVPGVVVVPAGAPIAVTQDEFDGGATMMFFVVVLVVPVLMMLQEVNP